MLSNFQSSDAAPIQFCLLGQPQFQRTLASAELTQLRQRVIVSYHLEPLNAQETRGYIEHRLRLVNWQNDPAITDEAFLRIHRYTNGVPRQVNTLCDRLLLYGMLEECHQLDENAVEEVATEMLREGTRTSSDGSVSGAAPIDERAQADDGPALRIPAQQSALETRVAALERDVKFHDKAVKLTIQLVTSYFSSLDRDSEPIPLRGSRK